MPNVICSGPGPHIPPSGILGTSSVVITGMLCESPACQADQQAAAAASGVLDGNRASIQTKAQAALAANATYLALASPTTVQAVAQVARLTRECNAVIRLLLGLTDDTDGT